MVGAETVRMDDPSLLCHTRRNDDLFRAVVTRSGRLPKGAQVFTDAAKDRTIVLRVGAKGGFPDLRAAMRSLGERGFMHMLCEGGLELARALAAEGLVDEWITVLAPKVVGHGRLSEAFAFPCPDTILYAARGNSPAACGGGRVGSNPLNARPIYGIISTQRQQAVRPSLGRLQVQTQKRKNKNHENRRRGSSGSH